MAERDFFAEVEEKFIELMSKYSSETGLEESLSSNEITNLRLDMELSHLLFQ